MNRRFLTSALSVCGLSTLALGHKAQAQNNQAVLDNEAVIGMVRSGQTTSDTVQAILNRRSAYRLSMSDINTMQRRAMIPRQVLIAMFDVSNGLQAKRDSYARMPTLFDQINTQDGLPYFTSTGEGRGYIDELRGKRQVAATSNNLVVRQMLTEQLIRSGRYDVILDHTKAEFFVEIVVNETRQLREGPRFGTMFDPLRTPTESTAEHSQLNVFRYSKNAAGMVVQRQLYSVYKSRGGARVQLRQNPIDLVISEFLSASG